MFTGPGGERNFGDPSTVDPMELSPDTAERYLRHAFAQMLAVADRLGDGLIDEKPHGESTKLVELMVVGLVGSETSTTTKPAVVSPM